MTGGCFDMTAIKKTALIFCDDQFGRVDGKTAAGLLRKSETYLIVGIIDRAMGGEDSGDVLQNQCNGIPIFADLENALATLIEVPQCYIYGKAPLATTISERERGLVIQAMSNGMSIVTGLHQFFSDDEEFISAANEYGCEILDIRKPPPPEELHVYSGKVDSVDVPIVAVLGTDCACGKMTTAVEVDSALRRMGINSVLIATGQTCLMQGAKYGISIDALVSQFVIGEVEHAVLEACRIESPDIVLVEGQSSVTHPAFMGSISILKGSQPNGVILQHPPARKLRCDFPDWRMPTVSEEILAIENIASTKVLALALSHEGVSLDEMPALIQDFEDRHNIPTTDVLTDGCNKLIAALFATFPQLSQSSAIDSAIASPQHESWTRDLNTPANRNIAINYSDKLQSPL